MKTREKNQTIARSVPSPLLWSSRKSASNIDNDNLPLPAAAKQNNSNTLTSKEFNANELLNHIESIKRSLKFDRLQ